MLCKGSSLIQSELVGSSSDWFLLVLASLSRGGGYHWVQLGGLGIHNMPLVKEILPWAKLKGGNINFMPTNRDIRKIFFYSLHIHNFHNFT